MFVHNIPKWQDFFDKKGRDSPRGFELWDLSGSRMPERRPHEHKKRDQVCCPISETSLCRREAISAEAGEAEGREDGSARAAGSALTGCPFGDESLLSQLLEPMGQEASRAFS